MAKKEKDTEDKGRIATHKRARFEFFIDERFEAGIVLQGWEVKALRQGRAAQRDSPLTSLRIKPAGGAMN